MTRKRPTELHDSPEHRAIPLERIEFRADEDDDNTLHLEGYASTFEPYEMYGGPANYGWIEQLDKGAFDKTLREKPDLHLLINHAGMPLARTKSGTLQLSTDDHGLKVRAQLDKRDPEVQALAVKMERGDMDEMSFAFRVKSQTWSSTDDFPDDSQAHRMINEVSLHKGDVSVVNWGANPATHAEVLSAPELLRAFVECEDFAEVRSDGDLVQRAMEKLSGGLAGATPPAVAGSTGTPVDGVVQDISAAEVEEYPRDAGERAEEALANVQKAEAELDGAREESGHSTFADGLVEGLTEFLSQLTEVQAAAIRAVLDGTAVDTAEETHEDERSEDAPKGMSLDLALALEEIDS